MLPRRAEEQGAGIGSQGGPGLLGGGVGCRSFVSKFQSFLLFCSILKAKTFLISTLLASKYSETEAKPARQYQWCI